MPALFVYQGLLEKLLRVPARPWEVGGWLLGWWADDQTSSFVTHATPPLSVGSPHGVTISGKGHRRLFDQAWNATNGRVTFLGDWHTHPGGSTTPSVRDHEAMRFLSEEPDFGTSRPLMAIVGHPRWPWSQSLFSVQFYGWIDNQPKRLEAGVIDSLPPAAQQVPDWWRQR